MTTSARSATSVNDMQRDLEEIAALMSSFRADIEALQVDFLRKALDCDRVVLNADIPLLGSTGDDLPVKDLVARHQERLSAFRRLLRTSRRKAILFLALHATLLVYFVSAMALVFNSQSFHWWLDAIMIPVNIVGLVVAGRWLARTQRSLGQTAMMMDPIACIIQMRSLLEGGQLARRWNRVAT